MYRSCVIDTLACPSWWAPILAENPALSVRVATDLRNGVRRDIGHAHRLHTELVRETGRLADPTDLVFDETHIDDPDALAAAIDDLLAKKPHLAVGEIGQGATKSAESVNLAALLRRRAQ